MNENSKIRYGFAFVMVPELIQLLLLMSGKIWLSLIGSCSFVVSCAIISIMRFRLVSERQYLLGLSAYGVFIIAVNHWFSHDYALFVVLISGLVMSVVGEYCYASSQLNDRLQRASMVLLMAVVSLLYLKGT